MQATTLVVALIPFVTMWMTLVIVYARRTVESGDK